MLPLRSSSRTMADPTNPAPPATITTRFDKSSTTQPPQRTCLRHHLQLRGLVHSHPVLAGLILNCGSKDAGCKELVTIVRLRRDCRAGRICAAWRKPSTKINHNARQDIFRLGPIGKRSGNSYFLAFSAEKSVVAVSGKSYRPTRKAGCRAASRQHVAPIPAMIDVWSMRRGALAPPTLLNLTVN
jgi:hypothetical protein